MTTIFRVSLPDGAHYDAQVDESLLAAAQRAHWLVRYGCRNGNCEACAAKLLQGRVRLLQNTGQPGDGTTVEAPHKILLCLSQPLSDVEIALPGDPRPGSMDQSLRSYARLQRQTMSDNESVLCFELPAGRKPPLLADQIALIETSAGLLQGRIDHNMSQQRTLIVQLMCASPLQKGAYYHVRYPLAGTYSQEKRDD